MPKMTDSISYAIVVMKQLPRIYLIYVPYKRIFDNLGFAGNRNEKLGHFELLTHYDDIQVRLPGVLHPRESGVADSEPGAIHGPPLEGLSSKMSS